MSFVPIVLPRFSGSTLEPTVEPLVIYPQQHEHKPLPSNDPLQPTRRTQSLKRKNKPTLITIPTVCKEFVPQEPDNEDYSPWSYEED
ncbi:uncharacterized protein BYT42DRAFT_483392, partial [Radiomyces spectabilis]|uniref:uncharacterized protein n=1 Tax=Radiomyces spectabilis TaxID=64574 RepID=UPI0022200545